MKDLAEKVMNKLFQGGADKKTINVGKTKTTTNLKSSLQKPY